MRYFRSPVTSYRVSCSHLHGLLIAFKRLLHYSVLHASMRFAAIPPRQLGHTAMRKLSHTDIAIAHYRANARRITALDYFVCFAVASAIAAVAVAVLANRAVHTVAATFHFFS